MSKCVCNHRNINNINLITLTHLNHLAHDKLSRCLREQINGIRYNSCVQHVLRSSLMTRQFFQVIQTKFLANNTRLKSCCTGTKNCRMYPAYQTTVVRFVPCHCVPTRSVVVALLVLMAKQFLVKHKTYGEVTVEKLT